MRSPGVARFRVLARAAWLLLFLACGFSATAASEQAPPWKAPLPAGVVAGTPMRFVRVVSAATNCQPNCPEWVSAEGDITTGAAQTFAHFIAELGGRRLPILINSRGGTNNDAIAMGRLIRAQRLVVAVARTDLWPCAASTPNCSPTPGLARIAGAHCMSACSLVLAGGVERYASAFSAVGVHQLRLGLKTMVMRHYLVQYRMVDGRKEEISRSLTGQDRYTVAPDSNDLTSADSTVGRYLKEMGIGDPIMSLMLSTPPSSIHVMSYDELVTSRLATMWMFDAASSLGADPDGLAASPVGSSPPSAGTFAVATQWPFLGAIDGHGAALAAQFRYRPGGGAIAFSSTIVDTASGTGFARPGAGSYVLANGKDEPIQWEESTLAFSATRWIQRDAFCRLRGSRRAFVEFAEPSFDQSDDERRREHLAKIDFAFAPNAAALFAEACSGPIAAAKR